MARTPSDAGRDTGVTRQVVLWLLTLAGISGLIWLLVVLGMPVAVAVPTVPILALLAVQVVRNLQGDNRPVPGAGGYPDPHQHPYYQPAPPPAPVASPAAPAPAAPALPGPPAIVLLPVPDEPVLPAAPDTPALPTPLVPEPIPVPQDAAQTVQAADGGTGGQA